MRVRIAPSILSADLTRLGAEVAAVEAGGADAIHVDVMDGHFVPNLSLGTPIVAALKRVSRLPLDVHLMIDNPGRHLDLFAKAGASMLTVHAEVVADIGATLAAIHALGLHAGVAINPATPVEALVPAIDTVDQVLIMSVHPGFSGQAFIAASVPKVAATLALVAARCGRPVPIAVDGGVDLDNCGALVRAGASVLVAATAIFKGPDPAAATRALRRAAENAA